MTLSLLDNDGNVSVPGRLDTLGNLDTQQSGLHVCPHGPGIDIHGQNKAAGKTAIGALHGLEGRFGQALGWLQLAKDSQLVTLGLKVDLLA